MICLFLLQNGAQTANMIYLMSAYWALIIWIQLSFIQSLLYAKDCARHSRVCKTLQGLRQLCKVSMFPHNISQVPRAENKATWLSSFPLNMGGRHRIWPYIGLSPLHQTAFKQTMYQVFISSLHSIRRLYADIMIKECIQVTIYVVVF